MIQFQDSKYPFMFMEDSTSCNVEEYSTLAQFIDEMFMESIFEKNLTDEDYIEYDDFAIMLSASDVDNDNFTSLEIDERLIDHRFDLVRRAVEFIQFTTWINSNVDKDSYVTVDSLINVNNSNIRDNDKEDIFDKYPETEEETKKNHNFFNSFIHDESKICERFTFPMRNPNPNRKIELRIYDSENLGKIPYVYIAYYPSKKSEIFIDRMYFKEV